ncbi:MAG TPA: hypothetical protein PLO37_12860 [Candidatus Hydrogenedentes bacterium]|mgnify:CR=1 FL=1|nr:hypothetical protein [Candidatus Hydrogenedentota bacterium]HPG67733.1 hypothetical protein [Candidatus Hydrogenedentota bacterium]
MLKSLASSIRRGFLARWPLFVVFVVGMGVALVYLGRYVATSPQWGDPAGWFGSAVMLATGHGFGAPKDPQSVPGYEAFMFQTTDTLDTRDLPEEIALSQPSIDDEDRRYMLYMAALTWWVMGVSWKALIVPVAFLYAVCAVFVYGLFRLGIGRAFSAVGTIIVMLSPGLLTILQSARDFSKAPFILGALLVIGHLLRRPLSRRRYVGLSAAVGGIIGLGFGFRQDLQICVLPALITILALARGERPLRVRWRGMAAAVMLACFLVPASPVLKAMYRTHAKNSHYLLQGFALNSTNELTFLGDSSYEPCPSDDDNLIHATEVGYEWRQKGYLSPVQLTAAAQAASDLFLGHAFRVLPFDVSRAAYSALVGLLTAARIEHLHETVNYFAPPAEVAGRKALLEVVKTFPADVVTRWYAAALRVVHGVGLHVDECSIQLDPFRAKTQAGLKPLADHVGRFGLVYALAAGVVLSAYNPWLAFVASMLLMYFAGYTSLLFRLRHVFHLGFVPVWLMLFLVDGSIRSGIGVLRRRFRQTPSDAAVRERISLGRRAQRVLVYAVAMLLCLAAPLYATRAYQRRAAGPLLERYDRVVLTRVDTTTEERGDWVLFGPRERLPMFRYGEDDMAPSDIPMEYLVVRLDGAPEERQVQITYEEFEFAGRTTMSCTLGTYAGSPISYYFPVYEYSVKNSPFARGDPIGTHADEWLRKRFLGVALPKGQASGFGGLYRVENAVDFPLMISVALPDNRSAFRWYKPLLWPWQVSNQPDP